MKRTLFKKLCAAALAACLLLLSGGCTYEDAASLGLSEADIEELTRNIPGLEGYVGTQTGETGTEAAGEAAAEAAGDESEAEESAVSVC